MLALTLSVSACCAQSSEVLDRRWRLGADSTAVIPYRTWLRMVALRVASDSVRTQLRWEAVRRAQLMSMCEERVGLRDEVIRTQGVELGALKEGNRKLWEDVMAANQKVAGLKGWATVGKVGVGVIGFATLVGGVVVVMNAIR